ncbi:predicted protein [Naegleria gruberi]|uniref:Predicted protein n=1 Tax=Naegleria gruberi TaxID=5762 RepID=D2VUP4_NAEGR|nr:uncharacterized protein NAEGRDRAFT_72736 [Naegleria gruberi]EFC39489.1 predicted protein [Naegleria gruberi]|eukprot:XP_002672233.1 predicted protein [Naegleria gruberi strain NEG-M]
MKAIILSIVLLAFLAITSVNGQFLRSSVYTDSKCSSTLPMLDLYIPSTNCTSNPNCTGNNINTLFTTSQCTSTVPSIGSKNTLQLSIYSDTTCASGNLVVSQIFPLDTCVVVPSVGSYKSTACRYLTVYSDSVCTNVKQTVDFSAYNGVCLSGTKYVCSGAEKMIGSSILMALMMIFSFFTF